MSADLTEYLSLITSEHNDKPDFIDVVSISIQGLVDTRDALAGFYEAFDVDDAVGVQLDIVGQWIGRTRAVKVSISGVYFSLNTVGVGLNQGVWYQTGQPISDVVSLPDDIYRRVLQAKALSNEWDGSIPDAYEVWAKFLNGTGLTALIQSNRDMSMTIGIVGGIPDVLTSAIITGGYIETKPSGVRIKNYAFPSADAPLFGFGAQNTSISGFGTGCWATILEPTA